MTTLRTIAAAFAAGGTVYIGLDWLIGAFAALATWILTRPRPVTAILFKLDTTTGEMQVQPADRLTEKYLKERG